MMALNSLMIDDVLAGRLDRREAQTVVAIEGKMIKVAELEMKYGKLQESQQANVVGGNVRFLPTT